MAAPSQLVWAIRISPLVLGMHLEAYSLCKLTLTTLHLSHRYGTNTHLSILPTELLEAISDAIFNSHVVDCASGWIKDYKEFSRKLYPDVMAVGPNAQKDWVRGRAGWLTRIHPNPALCDVHKPSGFFAKSKELLSKSFGLEIWAGLSAQHTSFVHDPLELLAPSNTCISLLTIPIKSMHYDELSAYSQPDDEYMAGSVFAHIDIFQMLKFAGRSKEGVEERFDVAKRVLRLEKDWVAQISGVTGFDGGGMKMATARPKLLLLQECSSEPGPSSDFLMPLPYNYFPMP